MNDYNNFKESFRPKDALKVEARTIKKTKILMIDHETGEVLKELENKILVPGSQIAACKQFGLEPAVNFPTYNTLLELQNSLPPFPQIQPYNTPVICLWAAGRSGASSATEIFKVSTTDRISPDKTTTTDNVEVYKDIVPFRYVTEDNDLDADQRQVYFGRKVIPVSDGNRIAYFFKAFDTDPQLHVRYLDGTEVTANMYSIDSSQQVEVYVEMRLSITRKDFRDYFDEVLGWSSADVSTISLLCAWYDDTIVENPEASEEDQIRYRWYQDILPVTKFNFGQEELSNLNRTLDFVYQVYY
jgi:hypothetical protein